jgi:glycosyltransferase involved in cell wall biosynthesis
MLIGLDASRTTAARPTGTERYGLRLIRGLLALNSPHRFRLYFRELPDPSLLPASGQVEQRLISLPRLWTHAGLSAELLRRPPDVLFVPAHVLPLIHPTPSVVTVHDLGYLHYPEAHPPAQRAYLRWSTGFSARGAARVLADSQATARDLANHYRIPPDKITVVYPGRDETLRPVDDQARLAAVRAKYDLPEMYLLHVGTLQPRKNLARLIEAFRALISGHGDVGEDWRSEIGLVLAGRKGWLYEPIFRRVEALGLAGRVRFVDYVDAEDMAALYSGARAFAFPSLYEGFGFPVLEAMACGTPVICSNASSLPEVAGEAALLVNPTEVGELAEAIERALTDDALRAGLVPRGFQQAGRFTWERAAHETLPVLEAAADGR